MTSSNEKHFPRYWPIVWGIHRSPLNSPHKGQWRGALMFSLICAWINGWVNNGEAGDLRRPLWRHCNAFLGFTLSDRLPPQIWIHGTARNPDISPCCGDCFCPSNTITHATNLVEIIWRQRGMPWQIQDFNEKEKFGWISSNPMLQKMW